MIVLSQFCENSHQNFDNVEIIHGDILELDLKRLSLPHAYLVVANIPYYITSILIRRLSETSHPPERMVLTVQREVAERICQEPGKLKSPRYQRSGIR